MYSVYAGNLYVWYLEILLSECLLIKGMYDYYRTLDN